MLLSGYRQGYAALKSLFQSGVTKYGKPDVPFEFDTIYLSIIVTRRLIILSIVCSQAQYFPSSTDEQ